MQYKITDIRVVNRFGKRYEADKDGIIVADSPEIALIFEAYGFTKLNNDTTSTTGEGNNESPKKKRNSKV